MKCPVCLDDTVVDAVFPFDCGHLVCTKCDRQLFRRAEDRCPMCRSGRLPEVSNHLESSDVAARVARREEELAQQQASHGETTRMVVFFPVEGATNSQHVVAPVQEELLGQQQANHGTMPTSTPINPLHDVDSTRAIDALVNTHNTSLSEFFMAVAALRSSLHGGASLQLRVRRVRRGSTDQM